MSRARTATAEWEDPSSRYTRPDLLTMAVVPAMRRALRRSAMLALGAIGSAMIVVAVLWWIHT